MPTQYDLANYTQKRTRKEETRHRRRQQKALEMMAKSSLATDLEDAAKVLTDPDKYAPRIFNVSGDEFRRRLKHDNNAYGGGGSNSSGQRGSARGRSGMATAPRGLAGPQPTGVVTQTVLPSAMPTADASTAGPGIRTPDPNWRATFRVVPDGAEFVMPSKRDRVTARALDKVTEELAGLGAMTFDGSMVPQPPSSRGGGNGRDDISSGRNYSGGRRRGGGGRGRTGSPRRRFQREREWEPEYDLVQSERARRTPPPMSEATRIAVKPPRPRANNRDRNNNNNNTTPAGPGARAVSSSSSPNSTGTKARRTHRIPPRGGRRDRVRSEDSARSSTDDGDGRGSTRRRRRWRGRYGRSTERQVRMLADTDSEASDDDDGDAGRASDGERQARWASEKQAKAEALQARRREISQRRRGRDLGASKIQARFRGRRARREVAAVEQKKHNGASAIQARFRGRRDRQRLAERKRADRKQHEGASKIQARYRGRRARRKVAGEQAPRPRKGTLGTGSVASRHDAAAIKVQSLYRGKRERECVQREWGLVNRDKLRQIFEEWDLDDDGFVSAQEYQSIVGSASERDGGGDVRQRDRLPALQRERIRVHIEESPITPLLQRWNVEEFLRITLTPLEGEVSYGGNRRLGVSERKAREESARKLQAVHRGRAGRKKARRIHKEQKQMSVEAARARQHASEAGLSKEEQDVAADAAARKIQAAMRSREARRRTKRREAAARKIQAAKRGADARKRAEEAQDPHNHQHKKKVMRKVEHQHHHKLAPHHHVGANAVSAGETRLVAMDDFEGQETSDLTFTKGTILIGLALEEGWWSGRREDTGPDGKVGDFPGNYVVEVGKEDTFVEEFTDAESEEEYEEVEVWTDDSDGELVDENGNVVEEEEDFAPVRPVGQEEVEEEEAYASDEDEEEDMDFNIR